MVLKVKEMQFIVNEVNKLLNIQYTCRALKQFGRRSAEEHLVWRRSDSCKQ